MRNTIIIGLLLWGVASTTYADRLIDRYFISAPKTVLPQLSENSRKDLLDLFDAQKESLIKNRFGAPTSITNLDENQITLQTSESSTLQIALLATSDTSHIIAVVQTVAMPAHDSRLSFYDSNWQPMETTGIFTPPTTQDFLHKKPKEKTAEAQSLINLIPIHYTITLPKTLQAEQELATYLPEEVYARIAPQLKKRPLVYHWDKKRFRRASK